MTLDETIDDIRQWHAKHRDNLNPAWCMVDDLLAQLDKRASEHAGEIDDAIRGLEDAFGDEREEFENRIKDLREDNADLEEQLAEREAELAEARRSLKMTMSAAETFEQVAIERGKALGLPENPYHQSSCLK